MERLIFNCKRCGIFYLFDDLNDVSNDYKCCLKYGLNCNNCVKILIMNNDKNNRDEIRVRNQMEKDRMKQQEMKDYKQKQKWK
jgi:hypothetical protein